MKSFGGRIERELKSSDEEMYNTYIEIYNMSKNVIDRQAYYQELSNIDRLQIQIHYYILGNRNPKLIRKVKKAKTIEEKKNLILNYIPEK